MTAINPTLPLFQPRTAPLAIVLLVDAPLAVEDPVDEAVEDGVAVPPVAVAFVPLFTIAKFAQVNRVVFML